jgi:hypothetical protein
LCFFFSLSLLSLSLQNMMIMHKGQEVEHNLMFRTVHRVAIMRANTPASQQWSLERLDPASAQRLNNTINSDGNGTGVLTSSISNMNGLQSTGRPMSQLMGGGGGGDVGGSMSSSRPISSRPISQKEIKLEKEKLEAEAKLNEELEQQARAKDKKRREVTQLYDSLI